MCWVKATVPQCGQMPLKGLVLWSLTPSITELGVTWYISCLYFGPSAGITFLVLFFWRSMMELSSKSSRLYWRHLLLFFYLGSRLSSRRLRPSRCRSWAITSNSRTWATSKSVAELRVQRELSTIETMVKLLWLSRWTLRCACLSSCSFFSLKPVLKVNNRVEE